MTRKWKERMEIFKCGVIFFLLVAFLGYGVHGFLFFIPKSWGNVDEFGEFVTTRDALTSTIALLISAGIFHFYNKYKKLFYSMKSAIVSVYCSKSEVLANDIGRYTGQDVDIALSLIAEREKNYIPSSARSISEEIIEELKGQYGKLYDEMSELDKQIKNDLENYVTGYEYKKHFIRVNILEPYFKHRAFGEPLSLIRGREEPEAPIKFGKLMLNNFMKSKGWPLVFPVEETVVSKDELVAAVKSR